MDQGRRVRAVADYPAWPAADVVTWEHKKTQHVVANVLRHISLVGSVYDRRGIRFFECCDDSPGHR